MPEIYVASPPPMMESYKKKNPTAWEGLLTFVPNEIYPSIMPQMASNMGVHYIDTFDALGGTNSEKSEMLSHEFKNVESDGIHYGYP